MLYKSHCIGVSLETWLTASDEVHIIANDLLRNCAEYVLQTWFTPTGVSSDLTFHNNLSVTNGSWNHVSLQVVIWRFTYNQNHVPLQVIQYVYCLAKLLIHYLSNVTLHEILKIVHLHSRYSLAVKYMNSKHDSRLVMKYETRCSTFCFIQ
jgi:ribulose-5-phosphate 4-epimerase/fuculose-1-phosphate aldolase